MIREEWENDFCQYPKGSSPPAAEGWCVQQKDSLFWASSEQHSVFSFALKVCVCL